MTEKLHSSDQQPEDRPYEAFPSDDARRIYHVKRGNGMIDSGWIAFGTQVVNGREYTRVGKMIPHPEDPTRLVPAEKDIPTDVLHANHEAEVARRRATELGAQAAQLTAIEDTLPREGAAHIADSNVTPTAASIGRGSDRQVGGGGRASMEAVRTQADAKHAQVLASGATYEEADAAAARVWARNGY